MGTLQGRDEIGPQGAETVSVESIPPLGRASANEADACRGRSWALWSNHGAHEGDKNQCQSTRGLCEENQDNSDAVRANDSQNLGSCCAGAATVYRDSRSQLSNDPSLAKRDPISPCNRHRYSTAMVLAPWNRVLVRLGDVEQGLRR